MLYEVITDAPGGPQARLDARGRGGEHLVAVLLPPASGALRGHRLDLALEPLAVAAHDLPEQPHPVEQVEVVVQVLHDPCREVLV